MTEQLQHTPPTALEALQHVWSTGWHSLCIQTPGFPFRTFGFYDNPEELLAVAAMNPDANCWFGVHGLNEVPAKGRGSRDDVGNIIALSADFDWADEEAHSDAELPDELEVRKIVAEMHPQPTLVIDSGHGLQAYWTLMVELDRADGTKLIDGFFRYVERTTGLKNDRIDVASILRVPGSLNQKTEPQRTVGVGSMLDEGYFPDWLLDNCWDAEPPRIAEQPTYTAAINENSGPAATVLSRLMNENRHDETPKDWMCRTYDGYAGLLRLGWQPGTRRGDEEALTRPGKDPRMGTSAAYHHDTNVCNIFTTTIHPAYGRIGLNSKNGVVTLNPFDVYCIENDLYPKDAMSVIRKTLMLAPSTPRPTVSAAPSETAGREDGLAAGVESATNLNLPDAFWEARPMLAHIKQAAHSRTESPDSLLAAVIARYATCIPTGYMIPAMVGATASFDHLGVLVGASTAGKSTSMKMSKELFLGPKYKTIVWDLPAPSGEGLVSSFFEMVADPDNPKKFELKKTKNAVHFSVGEAMAVVNAGQRSGSNIASVLCSAWAGENPGQANASAEKRRIGLESGTFRMSGLMAIQDSLGHNLLTEAWIEQGLTGRLLFASTEDINVPHWTVAPEWPGPLDLVVHPSSPRDLDYDEAIVAEVRQAHWEKKTGSRVVRPIDGHKNLLRLKLAGILALMDARVYVNPEDWRLATQLADTSDAIRDHMQSLAADSRARAIVTAGTGAAHFDIAKAETVEAHERKLVAGSVLRKLEREPGCKVARIRSNLHNDKRSLLPSVMEDLVAEGKIRDTDDGWFLVGA